MIVSQACREQIFIYAHVCRIYNAFINISSLSFQPTVSLKDLTEISEMANEIVDKRFKVYCQEVEPDHIDLVKAAFPKCQDVSNFLWNMKA